MITAKNLKVSAIIAAAGRGERAGFPRNKLLFPLHGEPALYHTFEKFNIPEVDEVIVTSSKVDFDEIETLAKPFGYKVVLGGKTRTESVKNALSEVTGDIVLVHDGARPYVSRELILNCIDGVERFGSAVCGLHCTDTLAFSNYGMITGMPDRNSLYRLQTPQGFYTDDLRHAYELSGDKIYTDDSSVYGEYITFPRILPGDEKNRKLTFSEDFENDYPPVAVTGCERVGHGADVHAFGAGNHITLAGVKIKTDYAFVAHSDGDVILHSLMDALLSAAGLEDIGHYFPVNDDAYKGADSSLLLAKVIGEVKKAGYAPVNISVTVQAEKPKLAKYIDAMRQKLSELVSVPLSGVAISAGTCEGLGFVGKGLGISAQSTVLLKKVSNG